MKIAVLLLSLIVAEPVFCEEKGIFVTDKQAQRIKIKYDQCVEEKEAFKKVISEEPSPRQVAMVFSAAGLLLGLIIGYEMRNLK
jgi:hypothetical protein